MPDQRLKQEVAIDRVTSLMEEPQHRPRRAYKRYPPEVWNEHKETVRQLFLEHDKTYKEVVTVLSERHGLTVGERQLKRKTEEWGFFKNIPSQEMEKMVRKRRQRRQKLGRPTKFRRKQGDGEFHPVPAAKLALHERRRMEADLGLPSSPSSTNSSLPSNIECYTPSDYAPSSPDTDVQTTPTTPTTAGAVPKPFQGPLPSPEEVVVAAQLALDGKYPEAAQHFRHLGRCTATSSPWGSVLYNFNAEIMEVAVHGGCLETLGARVSALLSRYLFREREKQRNISLFLIPSVRDTDGLRKVSSGLQMNAKYWGSVVVAQRALQLWEPELGPNDGKIIALWDNLASKRRAAIVNLDSRLDLVRSEGTLKFLEEFEKDLAQFDITVEGGFGMLSLGNIPDELRARLEAIEFPRIGSPIHNRAMVRFGRSRAIMGMLYSFSERYADAQIAFHDSAEAMCFETCVEVKLHRMTWDAEHRTRILDWDGAWELVCESRRILLGAEKSSPFFSKHFEERFTVLELAIKQTMSVDRVNELRDTDNGRGQMGEFYLPATGTGDGFTSSESQKSGYVMPASLSGTGVDIGAWRDCVLLE